MLLPPKRRLRHDGHDFDVSLPPLSGPEDGTRVVIDGPMAAITITRERRPDDSFPAEVDTGDERFDRDVRVHGPVPLIRALLDRAAREAMRAILWGPVRVGDLALRDGELSIEVPGRRMPEHKGAVDHVLQAGLRLASRLVPPADVAQRLAELARRDPVPRVRFYCLHTLAQEFPRHAATRSVLQAALKEADPEHRLAAAIELGEGGRETLRALARDRSAPDSCSRRALEALGAVTLEDAKAALAGALGASAPKPGTARSCLSLIARHGGEKELRTLASAMSSPHPPIAVAAVEALGSTGIPAAETAVLSGLRHPRPEVRLAATRVLAQVGSAASVIPLRDVARRRGGELRRQAEEAIASIQARIGGEPGRIALAQGEAGQVSLSEDPTGRVSLPKRP